MNRGQGYGTAGSAYYDEPERTEYRDDPHGFGSRTGGGYQGISSYGDFNGVCDTISSNVFKINNNATALDRSARQLGTNKDSIQLRDRIHALELDTNGVINDTAKAFHVLSDVCIKSDRQQKLQFERLRNEFQQTIQRYNNLQKKIAEKVRASGQLPSQTVVQDKRDTVGWMDDEADDQTRLLEEEKRHRQMAQLQAQDQDLDTDMALLMEREDRIRQLEGDILDINSIFKELGTLVHEQGEVIDTIEANVESAHGQVEAGNEQLIQAARYQRKARKKVCILILILVIVAAVLALIIYLSVKK